MRKTRKEIFDSISDSGRNFNEEFMTGLWVAPKGHYKQPTEEERLFTERNPKSMCKECRRGKHHYHTVITHDPRKDLYK